MGGERRKPLPFLLDGGRETCYTAVTTQKSGTEAAENGKPLGRNGFRIFKNWKNVVEI